MADTREVFNAWRTHVASMGPWRDMVEGSPEHIEGFGDIYRLPNLAARQGESLAVVDMSKVGFVEARRNIGSLTIYCVLEGSAHAGIGHKDRRLSCGDAAIIPPRMPHFMHVNGFVTAVITSPAITADQVSLIDPCNPDPGFDRRLYKHIAHGQPLSLPV